MKLSLQFPLNSFSTKASLHHILIFNTAQMVEDKALSNLNKEGGKNLTPFSFFSLGYWREKQTLSSGYFLEYLHGLRHLKNQDLAYSKWC